MKPSAILPPPAAIVRESVVVILGAILAAAIIGQLPGLRAWIRAQWEGAPQP